MKVDRLFIISMLLETHDEEKIWRIANISSSEHTYKFKKLHKLAKTVISVEENIQFQDDFCWCISYKLVFCFKILRLLDVDGKVSLYDCLVSHK